MPTRDIIVMGGSAGAIEAAKTILRDLPADLPASVFIVQHISPHARSLLPEIFGSATGLTIARTVDGEPIRRGTVYIAPPDHHLVLEEDRVRVLHGPRENRHRPAVDPLFRSAAWVFGPRAVGVVLSGTLDDGTAGLWAIKHAGGVAVVQDPEDSLFGDMPGNAIQQVEVDHVVPLRGLGTLLQRLVRQQVAPVAAGRPRRLGFEVQSLTRPEEIEDMSELGERSPFTCPSCGGGLWEIRDGEIVRYRCHVGHAYSVQSLLADQTEVAERALEAAVRTMKEKAAMLHQLSGRLEGRAPRLGENYRDRIRQLEADIAVLEGTLMERRERQPQEAPAGRTGTAD